MSDSEDQDSGLPIAPFAAQKFELEAPPDTPASELVPVQPKITEISMLTDADVKRFVDLNTPDWVDVIKNETRVNLQGGDVWKSPLAWSAILGGVIMEAAAFGSFILSAVFAASVALYLLATVTSWSLGPFGRQVRQLPSPEPSFPDDFQLSEEDRKYLVESLNAARKNRRVLRATGFDELQTNLANRVYKRVWKHAKKQRQRKKRHNKK